jgi:hypothetical protein
MVTKRSIETMFDMPAGQYCGVLLRKRLMKRVLKLQNEYEFKIKQLLASNLDELQTSNWTINDNYGQTTKEQITGRYFDPNETDQEKLERIEWFKLSKPDKIEFLFESDKMDDVGVELSKIVLGKLKENKKE